MTELNELYLKLGNVRTMKRYAENNDMELLAMEEEIALVHQINNYFRKYRLTEVKGEICYDVQSKEYRNWDLRSSIDSRV